MKTAKQLKSQIIVAALCLAAPGLANLQAQIVPNAPTQPDIPRQTETTATSEQPLGVNKCSQLIGTKVKNQKGESLGTIKDVVVDFDTGRVSYCVLGVGQGAYETPRYLAVPLTALRPSANGTHLILNADKEKLAESQGFDRNNWPALNSPAWGAQSPTAPATAPSSHDLPRVQ